MSRQIETPTYREALKLAALVSRLSARFPLHYESVRTDLRRTVVAIPLNIRRGDNAEHPERESHYGAAFNCAVRCEAILHTCQAVGLIAGWDYPRVRATLSRVVAALTANRDFADEHQPDPVEHTERTGMLASVGRLASVGAAG